jgi:hypothetical protein
MVLENAIRWTQDRALAVCLSMDLQLTMEPVEKLAVRDAIDICKGQVSALFVSSCLSAILFRPFFHQLLDFCTECATCPAICLRLQTPHRMTGFSRLPPLPSFLRRLVMVPMMLRTVTLPRWLPKPSQCHRLVCLRSSQSLLEPSP